MSPQGSQASSRAEPVSEETLSIRSIRIIITDDVFLVRSSISCAPRMNSGQVGRMKLELKYEAHPSAALALRRENHRTIHTSGLSRSTLVKGVLTQQDPSYPLI